MNITTGTFKIADHEKEFFRIKIEGEFTGPAVEALREEVTNCISSEYDTIYIDVKQVTEADLSAANEIINAHSSLEKASKKMVLLYSKNSTLEKWVETTSLDRFVTTAIVPGQ
jgi:anti-anti-sigma factor